MVRRQRGRRWALTCCGVKDARDDRSQAGVALGVAIGCLAVAYRLAPEVDQQQERVAFLAQDPDEAAGGFEWRRPGGKFGLQCFIDLRQARVDALLNQREEQILLALEARVERACRVAGLERDRLDGGAAQTVPGKDALGGIQQLRAGDLTPLAAPGTTGGLTFAH